jgi:hypothetical protein
LAATASGFGRNPATELQARPEVDTHMELFRRLLSRWQAWRAARRIKLPPIVVPDFIAYTPNIARDVSRKGVRFYSLCGSCGARMESSATLCEECASKRTGFTGGY